MLDHAMDASGIPMEQGIVRLEARSDYVDPTNNETVIMQPDIVIIANN